MLATFEAPGGGHQPDPGQERDGELDPVVLVVLEKSSAINAPFETAPLKKVVAAANILRESTCRLRG